MVSLTEERSLNDVSSSCTNGTTKIAGSSQPQQSSGKSVWSPFDEKEEWNKISQIIDSFGSDIGANVKTSITPNNCKHLLRFIVKFHTLLKCMI